MAYQTINIVDKFKEFVNSLNDDLLIIFKKYCLGIRSNAVVGNPYSWTYDDYYNELRKNLQNKTDNGNRYVVYEDRYKSKCEKALVSVIENEGNYRNVTMDMRKPWSNYHSLQVLDDYIWEPNMYIAKGKKEAIPEYTLSGMQKNPGLFFYIHENIWSIDKQEIQPLIEEFYKFQCTYLYTVQYEYIGVLANKDMIYRTRGPLDKHNIKLTKAKTSTVTIPIYASITETRESIINRGRYFDF